MAPPGCGQGLGPEIGISGNSLLQLKCCLSVLQTEPVVGRVHTCIMAVLGPGLTQTHVRLAAILGLLPQIVWGLFDF